MEDFNHRVAGFDLGLGIEDKSKTQGRSGLE
jgi:hypothetical protein